MTQPISHSATSIASTPSSSPSCCEDMRARWVRWSGEHPAIAKIVKIAVIILSCGLVLCFPCMREWVCGVEPVSESSSSPVVVEEPHFKWVNSGKVTLDPLLRLKNRTDSLAGNPKTSPPVIGKSSFVSREMVEHLMRNKKNLALGEKYKPGDAITNMEGAMHTFVTPVCEIWMFGDYQWKGRLEGKAFGPADVYPSRAEEQLPALLWEDTTFFRQVILSASIHPDFEFDNVILPLVRVEETSIEGIRPQGRPIPAAGAKNNTVFRKAYEENLKREMIYALSPDHRIPAKGEIPIGRVFGFLPDVIAHLEGEIKSDVIPDRPLEGYYFLTPEGTWVSLEILFRIYVEQIRNEFKILNSRLPQGYVYTIDPPSIFCNYLGSASILNRLQSLAFKWLQKEGLFSNMKQLAFNDYGDPNMIALLKDVLPSSVVVRRKEELFPSGCYQGSPELALVIHNNSDGFGQNIEFEGPTSLDGVIGSFSNAALHLRRNRPDLVQFVY